MILVLVEVERNIKSAMVGNEKEDTQHTGSDAFIDPLSGLVEVPIVDSTTQEVQEIIDIASTAMVEENLQQSIPSEVMPAESPTQASTPIKETCRYFSIVFKNIRDEITIKKVVQILQSAPPSSSQNLQEIEHKIRSLGGSKISYLGEFQAYTLMQKFFQAGIPATLSINSVGDSSSTQEQDFLLDDLNILNDTNNNPEHHTSEINSTGAIAVEIPQNASEILLATIDSIPGYIASNNKGIVTSHSSISRIFFREDEKTTRLQNKIQAFHKNNSNSSPMPKAEIDKVFQTLLNNLQKEAFRRGANGVIGIQISAFAESQSLSPESDQIRLIASGTAVLLTKNSLN